MSSSKKSSTASASPRLNASIPRRTRATFSSCRSVAIELEHRQERLLRYLHRPDLLHALLPLLLFLEELALPGDVAAVELRRHVLAKRLHGLARQHAGADRRLDRHVEELPRDRLLKALDQRPPGLVRAVGVDHERKRVDAIPREEDVELHEV